MSIFLLEKQFFLISFFVFYAISNIFRKQIFQGEGQGGGGVILLVANLR